MDTHRTSSERKWCVLAGAFLLASDIPLCQVVPSQEWIGWQTHYPSVTAEWIGRGWNAGGRDWAATLAQVGGAEVIHFKGKINDTINPCLGHCRGGQGRIHTRCWLPRACST